jgi:hypothetical protein
MRLEVRERTRAPFSATPDVPVVIAFRAELRLRVKSVDLTILLSLPVFPKKRTFSVSAGMSQTSQERTRTCTKRAGLS